MLDTTTLQIGFAPVNPAPFKGRYAMRSLKSSYEAAFTAADLYRGAKVLVEPTLAQCAFITGTDINAVWWALRREDHREAIIAREMPLVPTRPKGPIVPISNGKAVTFQRLVEMAKSVDAELWLAAGTAAGL